MSGPLYPNGYQKRESTLTLTGILTTCSDSGRLILIAKDESKGFEPNECHHPVGCLTCSRYSLTGYTLEVKR